MKEQAPFSETVEYGQSPGLTDEERENALTWARLGLTDEAISKLLVKSVDDLQVAFGREIEKARQEANLAVLDVFYDLAKSGKHLGATMHWIKTHCSHLWPVPVEPTDETKPKKFKPYVYNPNDPNDRVRFTVYNNDHEPNHDY